MTHRPWPIVVIAIFHIFAPLINFYLSAQLLRLEFTDYFHLQMRQSLFSLALWVVLPVLAGISLLTFRLWSYYAFIVFMGIVSLYTLHQRLMFPHRVGMPLFMVLQFVNFSVILYFLSPQVKHIYLNKRIRWWQQKPRFIVTLPALLQLESKNLPIMIDNISEGGAYIRTDYKLPLKSKITLSFKVLEENFAVEALVIHTKHDGYGLLFNPTVLPRRALKRVFSYWRRQNIPVRGQELTSTQSFKYWIKDLFKTGHGVFPESTPLPPNKD